MRRRISTNSRKCSKGQEEVSNALVKIDLQREVFRLRLRGHDDDEIAEQLNIKHGKVASAAQVRKLVNEAYLSRRIERDKFAERFLVLALARYENLIKVWTPKAEGYFDLEYPLKDEEGSPVLDERGNQKYVWVEPDLKAAKLIKEITKDACEALGLKAKLRVEHTGANGSAIEFDVDVSRLTDEQIERLSKHPNLHAAVRNLSALSVGDGEAQTDPSEEAATRTAH